MKCFLFILLLATVFPLHAVHSQEIDDGKTFYGIDSVLCHMTIKEKVQQLSGRSFDTEENKRFNIPGFHMVDGPLGIGQPQKNGHSTAFPAPIALAATWDIALAHQMGEAIGQEAMFKHKNVLLAPCMNIQRFYGGGRNFESFSEDPFLSSRMSVGFIKGAQSTGVIACAKHFVCNNQERNRINLNVEVGERALREIYFPSFKAAVQEAGVLAVMTSYNKVNNCHSGENAWLINDVLKKEWGFEGLTISDWESIYSVRKAYHAGLDMEMPWAKHYGDSLLHLLENDELPLAPLDDKVRRILHVKEHLKQAGDADLDSTTKAKTIESNQQLAKDIAVASIVLLKNKDQLLPLDINAINKIAVVGPNASVARVPTRGSANVQPPYLISPLEGLYQMAGDSSKIAYAKGCDLIEKPYTSEGIKITNKQGSNYFDAAFYTNQRLEGKPCLTAKHPTIDFDWGFDAPEGLDKDNFSAKWTADIQVPSSGWYSIDVSSYGGYKLAFNHQPLIDQWFVWKPKGVESMPVYLDSNRTYPLALEYFESEWEAGIQLGIRSLKNPKIAEVKSKAAAAEVTLLFLGFSDVYEQEGNDRTSFSLPKEQLALLDAVAATGTKVVVVLNAGTAIEMESWIDKVDAVVFAWYAGMETGNALAEILTGKANPSGKLPFTYPRKAEDCSFNASYLQHDASVVYDEGIYVGYRYYEKHGIEPLFDFGFGLSYSTFEYTNMVAETNSDSVFIKLTVTNTGDHDGAEVVQVYAGKKDSAIDRPKFELKGFTKIPLAKGESKHITIGIDKKQLRYFDTSTKAWSFEEGNYIFQAGNAKNNMLASCIKDIKYK